MGFVRWSCWAMSCGHIGRLATIGPSHLAGSCRRFKGTVLAIGWISLIVRPFVGDRLC